MWLYILSRARSHNRVLQTIPPQIAPNEANLPRPYISAFFPTSFIFLQLPTFYRERIGLIPNPLCPSCGVEPHSFMFSPVPRIRHPWLSWTCGSVRAWRRILIHVSTPFWRISELVSSTPFWRTSSSRARYSLWNALFVQIFEFWIRIQIFKYWIMRWIFHIAIAYSAEIEYATSCYSDHEIWNIQQVVSQSARYSTNVGILNDYILWYTVNIWRILNMQQVVHFKSKTFKVFFYYCKRGGIIDCLIPILNEY